MMLMRKVMAEQPVAVAVMLRAEVGVAVVLQRRVPVDAEVLMMLVLSVEVVEAVAERKRVVKRKQATGVSSSRTMIM